VLRQVQTVYGPSHMRQHATQSATLHATCPCSRPRASNTHLTEFWSDRITKNQIVSQLNLPANEVENFVFGLIGSPSRTARR
jgi:hypothetical protein